MKTPETHDPRVPLAIPDRGMPLPGERPDADAEPDPKKHEPKPAHQKDGD